MAHSSNDRKSNRLVNEKSPYLQQHAYNPVNWYPWGEAAFSKARQENKPIFLSIGYSTCHWCHVMERESFEQDEVAVMNQHFVNIKVDREERPDIDKIYMTAVQASTGQGGWPMSVWLTPDLKPFFCGTYYPPDARYGRPGFKQLLERIHDVWETNRDGVLHQAEEITASLKQHAGSGRAATADEHLDETCLQTCFEQFSSAFDEVHGGFGGAPKFPRPVIFNFLFRYAARARTDQSRNGTRANEIALKTLRAMAEGGMFDQLGGGFHRYSVDERWLVSHFEKMLYDQGQLVASYSEAYQITRDPFFADIVRRTCEYVQRDLMDADGAFYSAEDADSEGVEGKFYVWQRREIEEVLGSGDEAEMFCRYYGVSEEGNWEEGNNVLHVTLTRPQAATLFGKTEAAVDSILAAGRAKLFAVRAKRIRPHRDEKILTSWNGLMISGLCKAAQALGEEIWHQAADRAAHYIFNHHYHDRRLRRTATVPAVLDDYAFFIAALIDLYETSLDPLWLQRAVELAETMIELFEDSENGGFFMTAGQDASIIVRPKEDYDGAEPSGNSVAALALLRLAQYAGRERYAAVAQQTLRSFGQHLARAPHAVPQMLCALDFSLSQPSQVIIAGAADAADTRTMVQVVQERYRPNTLLLQVDEAGRRDTLAELNPFLKSIQPINGKATAYLCENFACQQPTTSVEELKAALDKQPTILRTSPADK